MDASAQLLIVSPDTALRQAVQRALFALGHAPLVARSIAEAQRVLTRAHVDLLCLDSVLPRDEAERFWHWLTQARTRATPGVIFLASGPTKLAAGALPRFFRHQRHAVVQTPLRSQELAREIARLLAAGPRRRPEAELLRSGPVALDSATQRLLFAGGGALLLTPTEFRLLRRLMERPGEFVSADELLQEVWGYPPGLGGPEVVRAHVSNLRRKLRSIGEDPHLLRNIPYRGYGVVVPNEEARRPA